MALLGTLMAVTLPARLATRLAMAVLLIAGRHLYAKAHDGQITGVLKLDVRQHRRIGLVCKEALLQVVRGGSLAAHNQAMRVGFAGGQGPDELIVQARGDALHVGAGKGGEELAHHGFHV